MSETRQAVPPAHVVSLAIEVSGLSPCRSQRGAVIFRGDDVVSHGMNYKPKDFACDGSLACKANCRAEAIHAEQSALLSAGRGAFGAEMLHVKSVDGQLVPSGSPSCVQCSKLAIAANIAAVWLFHETGWHRYLIADFHRLSLAEADARAAQYRRTIDVLKDIPTPPLSDPPEEHG